MKKVLLFLGFFAFSLNLAFSQCTPVPFPGPQLTVPDTSQGLPPAVATQPYDITVHVNIPQTFTLNGIPIPVDSAGLITITGLPTGFNFITNSPNNFWPANSYGCIVIQGNPTMADVGSYNCLVQIDGYVANLTTPVPVNQKFKLHVLDSNHVSVEEVVGNEFSVSQNVPNPVEEKTAITYYLPTPSVVHFEVFNMAGARVLSNVEKGLKGYNVIYFNRQNLPAGAYFYKVSTGSTSIVKRMMVK
ncbi:MAG: T9SS type A sorting domain-containing protein [Bacteroidales bacterium]|nr:T9SS type A sorting domain-containing protein [Bacteroidales bacterium]